MEFTGERMIVGQTDKELEWEHLDRYYFVKQFIKDKCVLDAACGSGYGSAILSHDAQIVHGVDISKEAVDFATATYGGENVVFHEASVSKLPFEAETFDFVVSFETIEHISGEGQNAFLKEVLRVLKKEGIFVVSTPNREIYDERGTNHFHKKELSYQEFKILLESKFENVSILAQQWEISDVIIGEDTKNASIVDRIPCEQAEYLIAICSNAKIDQMNYQIRVRADKKLRSLMQWAVENHERNELNNTLIREFQIQQEAAKAESERILQEKQNIWGEVLQLRDKENRYHNKLEDIKAELARRESESQQLRDQGNRYRNELEDIKAELARRERESQQLRDQENRYRNELEEVKVELICREGECRQLQDKESRYLNELENKERERKDLEVALMCREGECQQLRDKEKRYLNELQEIKYELACREGECQQLRDKENRYLNELAALRGSRAYRLGNKFAVIARFFVPKGSKRAVFARLVVNMIKYPKVFLEKLTLENFKKFFRLLRKGKIEELQGRMNASIHNSVYLLPMDITPPDIVTPVTDTDSVQQKTKEDYAPIQVPQWADPQVSIIIPVYNQFEYTYQCIASILRNSGNITYEIIVGNDCSTDLTTQIDQIITGITCVNNETNLRFIRNCNHAAKYAKGKYILFLNNDTQVQENWLEPLVTLIESAEDIGMVGSKLIYPNGWLQEAGGILWKDGSAWNYGNRQNSALPQFNYVKEVDYISGASIMTYRWLWEEIGGFDELFAPAYCDDSDLAFTVRSLGYRVMYQPLSVVVHFEGISNGTDTSSGQKQYQIENSKKLYEKWKDEFAKHPDNGVNVFQARDRSYNRKTLLMVDHYVPHFDKDAGSRTVYQYLKLFVSLGFNVKFIGDNFYRHEPYTTALQQMGIEVLYGPDAAQHWQDWILENAEHIDYVFLNRPHIAPKYLDFIRKNTNAKIIYYGHDLAFLRGMREYEITGEEEFLREAQMWQPKELELMRKSDMAYYPSYVEVDEIHKLDADIHVKAIPAYLFEDVQWGGYDFDNRQDIMFIGGFRHRPNVDAVKWVASDVLPLLLQKLPDIRIHILGSNAPQEILDLASEHLIIEGFVTDEQLAEFYRTSRLSLVPLRYGAGIKGKVIEAMRFGTPVITTPTGAEGIANAESALVIEASAEALAERIAAIYNDVETLTQMSRNCIAYIQQNYSPDNAVAVIAQEFDLV